MTPATPERGTDLTRVLAEAPCIHSTAHVRCNQGSRMHRNCMHAALLAHLREHGALLDGEGRLVNGDVVEMAEHLADACEAGECPGCGSLDEVGHRQHGLGCPVGMLRNALDPKETT